MSEPIADLYLLASDTPPKTVPGPGEFTDLAQLWSELHRLGRGMRLADRVTVHCASGIHRVLAPLHLAADEIPAEIVFRAEPDAPAFFDGGIELGSWTPRVLNGRTTLSAPVPDAAIDEDRIEALFVNGVRRTPAAFPKNFEGYAPLKVYKTEAEFAPGDFPGKNRFFNPRPGEFNPEWYDLGGIEAVLAHFWNDYHLPVAGWNQERGEVEFRRYVRYPVEPDKTRIFWRNVREALTEPGEYYFDRTEKRVYYLPLPGETAENLTAVVPGASLLLLLSGNPEKGKFLRGVTFENLVFRHAGKGRPRNQENYDFRTDRVPAIPNPVSFTRTPDDCGGAPQAAVNFPGIVTLHGARDCAFRNCRFEHAGWYGLAVAAGCERIRIERCTFEDLGGGGMVISGIPAAPELATRRIVATDCRIAHCGRTAWSAVGILIGHAAGCLVEHNEISDLYYSGISCGWVWGYGDSTSRENRIGFNHIHDIGQKVLCDMGGIYTLGIQPGTRIYNNRIHDVNCRYYGGWGIYTDEGSSHIVIENNLCYDCSREAFHQHYGRENIVRRNLAAFSGASDIRVTVGRVRQIGYAWPGENYTVNYNFFGNVLLSAGEPFFSSMPATFRGTEFYSENNWFWKTGGERSSFFRDQLPDNQFRDGDFDEWRALGHDRTSETGDPGFVDADKRDFRLKPDSPLRAFGFPDPAVTIDGAGPR